MLSFANGGGEVNLPDRTREASSKRSFIPAKQQMTGQEFHVTLRVLVMRSVEEGSFRPSPELPVPQNRSLSKY
jgi:hypothetical protein